MIILVTDQLSDSTNYQLANTCLAKEIVICWTYCSTPEL